jgi:hypothetical protein
MATTEDDCRSALVHQWELIAGAVSRIELSAPSRIPGWTNKEVLAHLYIQPHLVARFVRSCSSDEPLMGTTDNLVGTKTLRDLIDSSAREGSKLNRFDLGVTLAEARALVLRADLHSTIVTLQGAISLNDYLVTRCVEAVVHGCDLVDPIDPDPVAQSITSSALLDVLSVSAPQLVAEARKLPIEEWIDLATGRKTTSGPLAAAMPVMT